MSDESFLRRWSRLKQHGDQSPPSLQENARPVQDARGDAAKTLPTLAQAAALVPDSDFSVFMARGVGKEVRRMALKKLFADPHFNQHDGLDVYMADYNKPDPLSGSMLASLRQARDFVARATEEKASDASIATADASAQLTPAGEAQPLEKSIGGTNDESGIDSNQHSEG